MNWEELFMLLIKYDQLDKAISLVENNKAYNFTIHTDEKIEITPLEDGKTEGTVYDFRSGKMVAVKFRSEIVSASKSFVSASLKSQKLKADLIKEKGNNFTFFDFQFLLYMSRAADVSSGFTWFRNSVKQIVNALEKGTVNLDGDEISSEEELNTYLKKHISGFEPLFTSVESIKSYS